MTTVFIGPFGGGKIPTNGASIKNYHILSKLKVLIPNLVNIDTENWKRDPFVLAKLFFTILLCRNAKYIVSVNNESANKIMRIIRKMNPKADIIYWVIGGSIGKWVVSGKINSDVYKNLTNIIVEGESMKRDFERAGITNVSVMPNFKKTIKLHLDKNEKDGKFSFIFLSRIIPQKGCDLIIEATRMLNEKGYGKIFSIDFYGPIEQEYEMRFKTEISKIQNLNYKGFLDLRDLENYNILKTYEAFLFPTYWDGEGCPGIIIDAFMAGLPILASQWNLNSDYIENDKTGILFPPKDCKCLVNAIKDVITGITDINAMSENCFSKVKEFDIDTVLSEENLRKNLIL